MSKYQEHYTMLMKLWLDNVIKDSEYNKIIERLNNKRLKDNPQLRKIIKESRRRK